MPPRKAKKGSSSLVRAMTHNVIGGDFELAPEIHGLDLKGPTLGAVPMTGRSAVYQIMRDLRARNRDYMVNLPEYLCASVVDAVKASGLEHHFYEIDERLLPRDLEFPPRSVVLLIRYFGLADIESVMPAIRSNSPGSVIIADEVQAPWAFERMEDADISFTSWRKAYPVVGGAPIRPPLPRQPLQYGDAFAAMRLAASAVKSAQRTSAGASETLFLALFEAAERALEAPGAFDEWLPPVFQRSMEVLNRHEMDARRRRNFVVLRDEISRFGFVPLLDLQDDQTPLFMPILVPPNQRKDLRRWLAEQKVFCPVHWPIPYEGFDPSPFGARLYSGELSLVVDHRYEAEDMVRQAEALRLALDATRG